MVVDDRHADVEVRVFAGDGTLSRALSSASKAASIMSRDRLEDISISLNRNQQAAGYVWFAAVGPEGDCVRVQEVPFDVG
jgi:hypothetical protein